MAIPFIPVITSVITNPTTVFVARAVAGAAIGIGVSSVAQKIMSNRRIHKFKKDLDREFERENNYYDPEKTYDSKDYKETA